jgi:hypothetical protein
MYEYYKSSRMQMWYYLLLYKYKMRLINDAHGDNTIKHTFAPYRYILQNQSIAFQLGDDCIHIWIIKARNRIGPDHMSFCKLFGVDRGCYI